MVLHSERIILLSMLYKVYLSAGSGKIHAKLKFLSTWRSIDFGKNYIVGRSMDLLFGPNLFFLRSFALLTVYPDI